MMAQWENEWISLSDLPMARAMMAQWENEWISLSVLPMGRAMMAQWENECISLSVLSVVRVMVAQWENEWISLSVLPMARAMMAQWENEWISLSVLPMGRVQFPAVAEYFKGLSLADHTLPTHPEPALQKMAQSPLNVTTQRADSKKKDRSPNMDRWWLQKEKKRA